MSVFPNAQNFTINNGSFTNVTGGLNVYRKWDDQDYPGLKILHQNAVWSASYNSEQRFPPPNCHLGTRTQVLEILKNWITDTTNRTSVYWLYGAAGVGKSAVAQTISEEFSASHLAASFFFARTDSSRNNLLSFFITISHQLATSSQLGPLLKYPIDVTVRDNPGIVHAVLEEQFQELIVMPCHWLTVTCRLTPEKLENLPRLIVIDGLDECIDIASQERLLSLIRKATSAKATSATQFPFKFLICSRPEPRIRNAFSHQDFYSILDCTDIGESFESGKDIAKYLRHEFGRIRQEHGQSMAHVAKDWPGNGIIQQLMLKACGQFIYATTVLKYIGDPDGLPTERLEIILKITVPDDFDSPYPDLDQLYMQILSVCPQRELLLEVMAHILIPTGIFFDTRYERRSPAIIEGIFSLPKGKVRALLSRLHSVLLIPENDKKNIAVRHASFVDFLTDRKRSGRYFVNTQKEAQHERVLFYLLKILSKSMINSWKHHFECAQSQFDQYACAFWGSHFQKIRNDSFSSRILTELNQLDVCGLLNMALQGKNVSLKVYSDTLKSCLGDFERVVQWAKALTLSRYLIR
ncbi:hypothetical protein BT96DRAFT_544217 [Gymnopus androsaceus JB14]|uniref:Nephrocystin 3-like N-terminal domain-containing protein n=1 Tax=Gymnopus androsaceus JB14 TaxID=1447944 RepID=A0A6A4I1F5_9AGAR|nr:hypothetical protein BT96DRAFT_544217 [Gymnopus androsaceus JB14]